MRFPLPHGTIHVRHRAGSDGPAEVGDAQTVVSSLSYSGEQSSSSISHSNIQLHEKVERLHGRDAEIEVIQRIYKEQKEKVLLIAGQGGVGKSTLVETSLRSFVIHRGGYFTVGKFDQIQGKEPYSALVAAFSDLCDMIRFSDDHMRVKQRIKRALGEDSKTLSKLVPNLAYLLDDYTEGDGEGEVSHVGSMFIRFKYLCRTFLRSVSSKEHPLVIFFDDIQWMDEASGEIIKSLVNDGAAEAMLIICAYRDNEFDPGKLLLPPTTPTIRVCNLSVDGMNTLIADMTQNDPRETFELSQLIHRKTHGSPIALKEFLDLLTKEQMMFEIDGQWCWDLEKIQVETNVADNVADLVTLKVFNRLPEYAHTILKLAAFLGNDFHVSMLEEVATSEFALEGPLLGDTSSFAKRDYLLMILDLAVTEGLLEKMSDSAYKFSHDKVQHCLYYMVLPSQVERSHLHLHYRIGSTLLNVMIRDEAHESMIFLVADNLNRGSSYIDDSWEKLQLAEINLRAGKMAVARSAFFQAAEYFSNGIDLLEFRSAWDRHYDLSLQLYSSAAEMYHCTGDFGKSNEMIKVVMSEAKTRNDKVRSQQVAIDALAAKGQLEEAIDAALACLHEYGYVFNRKPSKAAIAVDYVKAKQFMKRKTAEEILTSPVCTDEEILAVKELLCQVCLFSQMSTNSELFVAVVLKYARLSVTNVSGMSCPALAFFGAINAELGQYEVAHRYGQLAMRLLARLDARDARDAEAVTLLAAYNTCCHFRCEFEEMSTSFTRGYTSGLRSGDTDVAFLCSVSAIGVAYHSGVSLQELDEHCKVLAAEMKDFDQAESLRLLLPIWQVVQNLQGSSPDPSVLAGDAMDLLVDVPEVTYDNSTAHHITCHQKVVLAIHFERCDRLKTLVPLLEYQFRPQRCHYTVYFTAFAQCMASFDLFRATGVRKHRRRIRSNLRAMSRWANAGVENCKLPLKLLQAEESRMFDNNLGKTRDLFRHVISEAQRLGYKEQEAMAAEHAASAMMELGDRISAKWFLEQSLECLEDWGAFAKIHFLEEKWPELMAELDDYAL